jgi:hypothetical protein
VTEIFDPVVVDTDVVSFLFDQDAERAPRYRTLMRRPHLL